MSRHLRLIVLCVGLLANTGCSNEHRLPTGQTEFRGGSTEQPQPPSPAQRLAALALFEAVIDHEVLMTSPINWVAQDGRVVWSNGPCADGGSVQSSLDGSVSPASGTFLPTGSHTYVVSLSNCLLDSLGGTALDGVASAAYRVTDWSNVFAMVSADSVRGRGCLPEVGFYQLCDVTGSGSAVWTSVGSIYRTTAYTPATGSRLVDSSTGNVATFGGGSYSQIEYPPPQGSSSRAESRFDNLRVAINGTEYTLNGSLEFTNGFRSGSTTYAGEIRIISNGTLAARIYGDVSNALAIEVLVPLVPL